MLLLRNPTLLRLFLAQALFWSCAMIGITLTSLVGLQLAPLNGLATLLAEPDIVASVPDYTAAALTAAGGLRAEDLPLQTQSFELHMAWRGAQDNDPAERWLRSRIQMFCGDPDSL